MTWLGGRHGFPRPSSGGVTINTTGSPIGFFEEVIKRVNESKSITQFNPHIPENIFIPLVMVISFLLVSFLAYALITRKFFFIEKPVRYPAPFGVKSTLTHGIPREYYYVGLRRIIRELYLRFLNKLFSIGVLLKPGYTPREVAHAAKNFVGDIGYRVARLYEELMYSRRQPTISDVEEFKKAVGHGEG